MKANERKVIVAWDMDETLGYFVEIGMLWDTLVAHAPMKLVDTDFFKLLDLYPEFLRPDIMRILSLLRSRKKNHKELSVIVFTNNQGPRTWAELVVAYFNHKLKYNLFDMIIPAYKVNGRQIAECRTGHEKKHSDLLRCTGLPTGTPVCFIDDQNHPQMKADDVYCIQLREYSHPIPFDELLARFKHSDLAGEFGVSKPLAQHKMKRYLGEYELDPVRGPVAGQDHDMVISKKLYSHLQFFLRLSLRKRSKTRRSRGRTFKKTLKIF